jgi:hypothetical protein
MLVILVDKLLVVILVTAEAARQVILETEVHPLSAVGIQDQEVAAQVEAGLIWAAAVLDCWGKALAGLLRARAVLVELAEAPRLPGFTEAVRAAMIPGLRAEEELFVLFGLAAAV